MKWISNFIGNFFFHLRAKFNDNISLMKWKYLQFTDKKFAACERYSQRIDVTVLKIYNIISE